MDFGDSLRRDGSVLSSSSEDEKSKSCTPDKTQHFDEAFNSDFLELSGTISNICMADLTSLNDNSDSGILQESSLDDLSPTDLVSVLKGQLNNLASLIEANQVFKSKKETENEYMKITETPKKLGAQYNQALQAILKLNSFMRSLDNLVEGDRDENCSADPVKVFENNFHRLEKLKGDLSVLKSSEEKLRTEVKQCHDENVRLCEKTQEFSNLEKSHSTTKDECNFLKDQLKLLKSEFIEKCINLNNANKWLSGEVDKLKTENSSLAQCLKDEMASRTSVENCIASEKAELQDLGAHLQTALAENELLRSKIYEKEMNENFIVNKLKGLLPLNFEAEHFFEKSFQAIGYKLKSVADTSKSLNHEMNKVKNLEHERDLLHQEIRLKGKEMELKAQMFSNKCNAIEAENSDLKKKLETCSRLHTCPHPDECDEIRRYAHELKSDLINRNTKISQLEMHIQSCCNYYKKKAQNYKNEIDFIKNQRTFPQKNRLQSSETQTDSPMFYRTTGFIENHKIDLLQNRVSQLEKENQILTHLCRKRLEAIKKFEHNCNKQQIQ